jgi:hypothetical protein
MIAPVQSLRGGKDIIILQSDQNRHCIGITPTQADVKQQTHFVD